MLYGFYIILSIKYVRSLDFKSNYTISKDKIKTYKWGEVPYYLYEPQNLQMYHRCLCGFKPHYNKECSLGGWLKFQVITYFFNKYNIYTSTKGLETL